MNAKTQAPNNKYFDSVIYARAYINEIKIITPPKKGEKYCAVNASIIDSDADGNKLYRTVDLIVKGDAAKRLIWKLRDKWPKDRLQRPENRWIADINIGSPTHTAFRKKDGIGAVLKGRLINIRALQIGNQKILGEISEKVPKPVLVSPCYINLVIEKGKAKISILDGEIGKHSSQNVNLTFDGISAFDKLAKQGLCPRGYKYRDSNPRIFAIVEIEDFRAEGFKSDKGEIKSCLKGRLSGIRYLKANDTVIVSGSKKSKAALFYEGFKEGWQAA